jgi:hypothetical protein
MYSSVSAMVPSGIHKGREMRVERKVMKRKDSEITNIQIRTTILISQAMS